MKRLLFLLPALVMPASAQHDPGRDAVRWLAKGAVDKTLERLAKEPRRMNSPIDEAEKAFVRMMVACHQGKVEEATALAEEALSNGLPVQRLLAGPKPLLKPLYEHKPFQELLTWGPDQKSDSPNSIDRILENPRRAVGNPSAAVEQMMKQIDHRIVHGPMLGALTDRSASFWFRTMGETEVRVKISPLDEEGRGIEGEKFVAVGETSAERDYTAVIRVEGLKPNSNYRYEYLTNAAEANGLGRVQGSWLPSKEEGKWITVNQTFRTFPKQGAPAKFPIAFGGGAGYTPKYEKMWTTIAGRKPSALLLLGDNVYIDDPEHQLTNDYCYYRRQSEPLWRQLVAKTPVFAIYDDHDFGMNDCVPGPEIEQPAWKRSVWQTFRNNWVNPAYGGGDKQPGCWHDFTIGQVHFLMLDCRYYRDLKGGSMLGPVQKAWLKEQLKSSKGVFKVLVSSVPWSPGVKPGSRDTWDGFPEEREEIFSFLETEKIEGVMLMSADRHRSDYRKIPRPRGYDLYELMSSRLTNVHTHGLMKNAEGSEFLMGYNEKCSFGLVEFDTTAEDPTITSTIVNIDNEEQGKATLKLSELGFGE